MNIFLALLSGFFVFFSTFTDGFNNDITLNYFEYNRGMSLPTIAQIHITYNGGFDLTFHNVYMEDNSFFPDNSVIPNAFFEPLFKGDIVNAVKSFTEPYYGIRFYHFFKNNPNLGIGIDFIHFKVFVPDDSEYMVYISGADSDGNKVDKWDNIHNYIDYFNLTHGVNSIAFSFSYRMMLFKTETIKEGIVQPYVGFYLGPCLPFPMLKLKNVNELSINSYQLGLLNFIMGIDLGIRFQFFKHFGIYIAYKFTYTYLYNIDFDNKDGNLNISFPDNHIVWGISIIF